MNSFRNLSRFALIILLVLIFIPGKSQMSSFYVITNFQAIKSESFTTFANEYNSYLSPDMTKKIDPVRLGIGWGMGWNVATEEGLMIGIEYNKVRSKTSAEFSDGAVRDFKLSDGGLKFITGFSPVDAGENFYFYPFIGFTVGKNRLESTYTPGTNNFTGEMLNGNYRELALKYNFGLRAAFGSEKMKLLFGIEYIGKLIPIDLVDDDKTGSSYFTSSIGTDYDVFANDPISYTGNYIETDFKGLRFNVGISIDFGL